MKLSNDKVAADPTTTAAAAAQQPNQRQLPAIRNVWASLDWEVFYCLARARAYWFRSVLSVVDGGTVKHSAQFDFGSPSPKSKEKCENRKPTFRQLKVEISTIYPQTSTAIYLLGAIVGA